jgi:hypothetical protein
MHGRIAKKYSLLGLRRCRFVGRHRRFGEISCLNLQDVTRLEINTRNQSTSFLEPLSSPQRYPEYQGTTFFQKSVLKTNFERCQNLDDYYTVSSKSRCALTKSAGSDVHEHLYRPEPV